MVAVEIKGKRGKPSTFVTEDDEFRKANFDKFPKLATVFQRESGTITAGIFSFFSWQMFSRERPGNITAERERVES